MTFSWDLRLVLVSVLVAIVGSFAALECAARMKTSADGGTRRGISVLGAALMGLAIWTMHFVGMLALKMPMPVSYAAGWSALSMIAAAVGAGLAFTIMSQPRIGAFHVAVGGVAMGVAIAGMHYLGMKSMRMAAAIDYEPIRFILSFVIAIAASSAALAVGYWMPRTVRRVLGVKAGSAIIMGIAIAGMHYMGMDAARYHAASTGQAIAAEPLVGSVPLRDVVGLAGIVFGGALIALTTLSAVERQRALDDYRQLAGELEQRVQARTAELETMNRELSAFTYSVSHDLRGPLRTITGFTEILAESSQGEWNDEARDHLRRIRGATMRMDALLTGLLHLAHVSRTTLERSEVDLTQLAQTILADLRAHEPARNVETVVDEGVCTRADSALLTSALQNLLDNAWKFTARANPARIHFGQEKAGTEVRYFVQDNGVGFDLAHMEKLFGMFERLHQGSEFPGHGIGLAVTKRIIERHGGRIWAHASRGGGATFWFTLE